MDKTEVSEVSLLKRLAACLYELLSLVAIWLLCTAIFLSFFWSCGCAIKATLFAAVFMGDDRRLLYNLLDEDRPNTGRASMES